LRLFLGITFVYAGIQKITDPQFFDPKAIGYIGKQIARFSVGSPIGSLMVHLVSHAPLLGGVIIVGEVAIGLGTLFGFLFRPASFFGLLLSLSFFLSASWHTYPYFYGADIVFVFAWLTLLLSGPLHSGYPTLDEYLIEALRTRLPRQMQHQIAPLFALVLGSAIVSDPDVTALSTTPLSVVQQEARMGQGRQGQQARVQHQRKQSQVARVRENRRHFLLGGLFGALSGIAMFGFASLLLRGSQPTATGSPSGGTTSGSTAPASGTTTSSRNVIAQVSAVPTNSAATFTLPSNGDPGVLVHLTNGQFVAYDATCTHAGCPVSYDPTSQLLQCPCHGAAFDPAKNAEVVNPPAPTPLTTVHIKVDSATGTITLVGA
jgi:thiosulfate dehydrogenase [quinone] large subunit